MAVRHVKVGGTLASGNSTADDWSLTNCYPTIASALSASGIADGDELILDDEEHDISSQIIKNFNYNGTYKVRARTARLDNSNRPTCIISGSSATGAMLLFNDTVNRVDFDLYDVLVKKSVAHTDANRPIFLHATQKTGSIKTHRCWIGETAIEIAGSADWEMGFIRHQGTPALPSTAWYSGVKFTGITANCGTGAHSLCLGRSPNSGIVMNVLEEVTFNDITVSTVGVTTVGGLLVGPSYVKDISIGTISIDSTSTVETEATGAILWQSSYGSIFARNIKIKNVTHNGLNASPCIRIQAAHNVENILGINAVLNSSNDLYGSGALITAFSGALGRIRRVRAFRCHSRFGPAVYYSNGANGIVEHGWAEECTCFTGLYYKGGDGDLAWSNLVAVNNTQVAIGDVDNSAFILHSHNSGSSYTRDCVVSVRDLVAVGNTLLPGSHSMRFFDGGVTYKLDVKAKNIVLRDTTSHGEHVDIKSTEVNLDIWDSNIRGGSSAIVNNGTGVLTTNNITDEDVVIIGGLHENSELSDPWPVAVRVMR